MKTLYPQSSVNVVTGNLKKNNYRVMHGNIYSAAAG